jgi:magnesium-transporting ATPase (P-type)
MKERALKGGITDPAEHLNKAYKQASEVWSWTWMFGLVFIIIFSIANLYSAIIKESNLQLYHFIFFSILSSIINHLLLFRHNKYKKYFKEFDNMEKAERTKWAWISFLVVLSVIIFFFGSFMILTYRLHH